MDTKYIYLDQNKWIELAKGIKNNKCEYVSLFNKMQKYVTTGQWAFPLSLIHIAETTKRKEDVSRGNLLDLMYTLSKGCAICDYTTADIFEFNNWLFEGDINISKLKTDIIDYDFAKIIGLSTKNAIINTKKEGILSNEDISMLKALLVETSCSREFFDMVCSSENSLNEDEKFYYECLVTARKQFKNWKSYIESLDEYKGKHVYPAYLIKMFFEQYQNKISDLPSLYKDKIKNIFEANTQNKTNTIALLEILPGFNVYNRLTYEILINPHKEVHKHDFFDLAFLRVAVPYCDIVISENYWVDRIKNCKLDTKYNTKVTTDIFELKNL